VPLTDHLGLVSLTSDISMRNLLLVAAAIQKQLTRDFTPIWGNPATVSAFEDLASMPSDYHPVVVFNATDELVGRLESMLGEERTAQLVQQFEENRVGGIHLNAVTRQPFALVEASDAWSVVVSHEAIELVADKYGNQLVGAAHPLEPQERVDYLLEVCDPCQGTWYPVNGVPVSDFYTPRYFDPVRADGVRYSYTGEIERPLQILDGGYVSWIDPADSGLYQLGAGDREPVLISALADLARTSMALRTVVDTNPRTPRITSGSLHLARTARTDSLSYRGVREASEGSALRAAESILSLALEP
jgi:hypothetical protein